MFCFFKKIAILVVLAAGPEVDAAPVPAANLPPALPVAFERVLALDDYPVLADHVLDGGGLANFSRDVASVAATGALGIYDVPKADITTVALHSRGVTAGSMRGFGTLQAMTAL